MAQQKSVILNAMVVVSISTWGNKIFSFSRSDGVESSQSIRDVLGFQVPCVYVAMSGIQSEAKINLF